MATWIAHLRIAQNLLDLLEIKEQKEFIVGNIGPDCGVPNEDWSSFTPSGDISHWRNSHTRDLDYKGFYREHCSPSKSDFYLGYYVHLKTDMLWRDLIYRPNREKHKEEFEKNPKFVWTLKEDWYDQDKVFLNENILPAYEVFREIKEFPNCYLDYYPENAFTRQIQYISNFYDTRDRTIDRDFPYLDKREMDSFVETATRKIHAEWIRLNITTYRLA